MTMEIRDRVVELRRVRANTLLPHPHNWRTHNDAQRAALRALVSQVGFAGAMLAVERPDGLMLVDGHLRTEEAGDQDVPVLILDLNDDEVNLLLLSYDPLSAMAGTHREKLEVLLAGYDRQKELNPDFLHGLQSDLDKMLKGLAKEAGSTWGKPQAAIEDEVPEVPAVPVTEPGDLWILGRHRLLCGDNRSPEQVAECFAGSTPFMMVTDPPYGVDYDPTFRSNNRTGVVANDHTASWPETYRLFGGQVAYVWHGGLHVTTVGADLQACDFELRAMIIWRKPALVMGRGHYHWQHEGCFYAAKGTAKWNGDRTQSTIWEIDHVHPTHGTNDDGQTIHGCQKPVECMARPIRNHGGPEDDVYDPFVGSGTTIIACEQLGRRCLAMEVEPGYVDVAAERWGRFAKQEPILESTGETFTQVKDRRTQERAARAANPESQCTEPAATIPVEETTEPASNPNGNSGKHGKGHKKQKAGR